MQETLTCTFEDSPACELRQEPNISQEIMETIVVAALKRALAALEPLPLFHSARQTGLFPKNRAGQQAAQYCQQQGWLHILGEKPTRKSTVQLATITQSGLIWLLEQTDLRTTLQALHQRLEQCETRWETWGDWLAECRQHLQQMQQLLQRVLDKTNDQVGDRYWVNGHPHAWLHTAWHCLRRWQETHPHKDCPLPELFRQVQENFPDLTLGQFQDGLRQLYHKEQIFLHPWAGPIYEIPEPEFAMMVGHALVYYASCRDQ